MSNQSMLNDVKSIQDYQLMLASIWWSSNDDKSTDDLKWCQINWWC